MRAWVVVLGVVILSLGIVVLAILAIVNSQVYCYGGGVEHVTTTNSNGSSTVLALVGSPICLPPPNILPSSLAYFGIPAVLVGIFLVSIGSIEKRIKQN